MSTVIATAVPIVVAAALVLSGSVLVATRDVRAALPVLLDLLLVAGLVRLSATGTWEAIGSAALVVVIRKVVTFGITTGRAALDPLAAGTGAGKAGPSAGIHRPGRR